MCSNINTFFSVPGIIIITDLFIVHQIHFRDNIKLEKYNRRPYHPEYFIEYLNIYLLKKNISMFINSLIAIVLSYLGPGGRVRDV